MAKPEMSSAIDDALKRVFDRHDGMTPQEYSTYLEAVAVIAIGGIRGHYGDEHARGFLEAAIKDLDKPGKTFVMPKGPASIH